ncbi:MAG: hypothetical protein HC849_20180 [Oscillatoriales cyanobacterium RU_3_3]|nr:hypothetical protein [Microcoleus sp. SU_5_6]NJM61987.1 hypothetical protein [Oscillatoriales cyanobacterium RU_3_3]NJR24417.1 hypothetical protein [Richelia sp. CSU_2_1]
MLLNRKKKQESIVDSRSLFGSRGEAKRRGCPRDRKRVLSFELRDVFNSKHTCPNPKHQNSKLFKITNYQFPIPNYQFPIPNYC